MAVTYTVTNAGRGLGPFKWAHGTFTTAEGDGPALTLSNTTHGMNYLVLASLLLNGFDAPVIGQSVSGGEITWQLEDTRAASGRWFVLGL